MQLYEIPEELKSLYKHWEKHADAKRASFPPEVPLREPASRISIPQTRIDPLITFAAERMRIWNAKTQGLEAPYTTDSILAQYRFCNIYRELDKQTIQYHRMLKSLTGDFPLWLMNMFFARLVARPETLETTGLLSFDPKQNALVYEKLLALSSPKYGVPYVFPISTILKTKWNTREKLLCEYLPERIKACTDVLVASKNRGVLELMPDVLAAWGFNHAFLWNEVLIDVAYQYPERVDLFKLFPIGPGSRPTMLMLTPDESPEEACLALSSRDYPAMSLLSLNGKPIPLSAENWEGIGCEYRKYTNLLRGIGRKRSFK